MALDEIDTCIKAENTCKVNLLFQVFYNILQVSQKRLPNLPNQGRGKVNKT